MQPTIHLAGTEGLKLQKQVDLVRRHLKEALKAMGLAAPDAKDYTHQGNEAIHEAKKEHKDRVHRIKSVILEYRIMGDDIYRIVQGRSGPVSELPWETSNDDEPDETGGARGGTSKGRRPADLGVTRNA